MEKVAYFDQPNCYRLSNGTVEAIVTTDIGPRVIRYGFAGGENMLAELPDESVKTEYGVWKPWGGHRLWHAPEAIPRTYVPDNTPIGFQALGDSSARLVQPTEKETGVRKEMTVTLDADGTRLTLRHSITNCGPWDVELAPWALTIMNGAGGGTVILPQEPYRSHDEYLLPARAMVLWHYTDLSDPRWQFGKKYVRLNVDAKLKEPQKLGLTDKQGWAAYAHDRTLFVKRFAFSGGGVYPDGMCNCETYTAGSFVEVETLGVLSSLAPGASAEHVEQWYLFKDVEIGDTDESVDAAVAPLVAGTSSVSP